MKRKLFCLLTLLLTVCSGAWADVVTLTPSSTSYSDAINVSESGTATATYADGVISFNTHTGNTVTLTTVSSYTNVSSVEIKYTFVDKSNQALTCKVGTNEAVDVEEGSNGSEKTATVSYATAQTGAIVFTATCSKGSGNAKAFKVSSIKITYTAGGGGGGSSKTAAGLAYGTSSVTKNIGDANFTNSLTNPHSLTISYSITSNGTGSTINTLTGEVTVGSVAGTETITATSDEDEDYEAGLANYTLTVQESPLIDGISLPTLPTGTYSRGTDVVHKDDKYAVVCDAFGNALMQASAPGYGSPTGNFTWANAYTDGSDGTWSNTGDDWDAPAASVFVGSTAYNTSENAHNVGFARRCNIRPARTVAYKFTNSVGVSALVQSASTTDATAAVMAVFKVEGSTQTLIQSVSSKTGAVDVLTVDGLNTSETYVAYVYGKHASGYGELYEIAFLAPDNRTEVELSFSSDAESATMGLNFTEPTLSADPEAQLGLARYSSSNTDVATVNETTGEITLVSAGSTTISAAIPNDNISYKSNTASYTLTVAPAPSTGTIVNAAQVDQVFYAVNGNASPSLTSSGQGEITFGNIITITGTNMQQGTKDYSIDDANRKSFKVGTGDYVITPANSSITITAVKLYGYVNKDAKDSKKGQITTGGVAHDLNARDSGAENLVSFDLVANGEGNFAFSVTAPSSDYNGQDIIVLKVTYDVASSVDVTVSSVGYATLYYGSDVTIPDGVEAYYGKLNGSSFAMKQIEDGKIPANTGVILKAAAGTYNFKETTGATAIATEDNDLTGTTEATTVSTVSPTYGVYTLGQNSEGVVGMRNYTGSALRAYSAYIIKTSSDARSFIFFDEEGETTAINAALMNNERMNNEFYNLNGQRVAQPTKGLYIVNGRKVVIK